MSPTPPHRQPAPAGRRPNLLYIHSDQHNPFVTGCYGDPVVRTPNLDALARRGVTFTNAYCPSPVCVPSRMAMLTGKHPHELGVWTNHHILGSDHPTIAHAMGAAGYRPVLMGRMHAVGVEQLHGYAERPIGDHGSNHPGDGAVPREARGSLDSSGAGQSSYQVHDEDVTAAAIDYLNRFAIRRRAGIAGGPFCLSVGFMLPHAPYVARRADFDRYRDRVTLPRVRTPFDGRLHPFEAWWRSWGGVESVSDDVILRTRAAYWALIDRMDALIGDILEASRRNGLDDDTLIVYHSDHGDMAGEHDLWMKRCHYDPSARIPAIVSWPGALPEGVRCDRVISALDLNATMLAALGADPLPGSHGRSLLDLIADPQTAWDDAAWCEYCVYEGWTTRMVRREDWKFVYYHGHRPQLFNLREDPDETADRSGDPACAALVRDLTAAVLADWDPDAVERRMAERRRATDLIARWSRRTGAPERFVWPVAAGMDYLE